MASLGIFPFNYDPGSEKETEATQELQQACVPMDVSECLTFQLWQERNTKNITVAAFLFQNSNSIASDQIILYDKKAKLSWVGQAKYLSQ